MKAYGPGGGAWLDADIAIVGDEYGEIGSPGVAFVFERNVGGSGEWIQTAELTSSDGVMGDEFGDAVVVSGSTILVGAPGHDSTSDLHENSGASYVFEKIEDTNGGWRESAKLRPPDPGPLGRFGISVSIHNDTAVVGAMSRGVRDAGAAYVFSRSGNDSNEWVLVAKLQPPDGSRAWDFGSSTALYGDTAAVGSSWDNATYLYSRHHGGLNAWGRSATLQRHDSRLVGFGDSISIDGVRILIGAIHDNELGTASGSASIFERALVRRGSSRRLSPVPDRGVSGKRTTEEVAHGKKGRLGE